MGNTNLSPNTAVTPNNSAMTIKINEKILTATFIFLFFVSILIILLIIYAKNNWIARIGAQSRTHLIITTTTNAPILERGLSVEILRSLPVTEFRRIDFKDRVECSVCLSEVSDGEKFRLLPKCKHGFHVDCIDMWLHSHSTCPLCRCEVLYLGMGEQRSTESSDLPNNIGFWRNNGRFNTRGLRTQSERSLVVEISGGFEENLKTPVEERSAGTSKFGSLRRIVSRREKDEGSSCGRHEEGDIEQGFG